MQFPSWVKVLLTAPWLMSLFGCSQTGHVTHETAGKSQPIPTPWIEFGDLNLISGQLWVGDAQFAPFQQHGLVVDLQKGHYVASIQKMDFGSDDPLRAGVRVSRLRLAAKNSHPRIGDQIGKTWADSGTQGVCDFQVYSKAMPKSEEAYWKLIESPLVDFEYSTSFVLDAKTGAKLLLASSGFGDGEFRVFELVERGERCGIEIELIGPDE